MTDFELTIDEWDKRKHSFTEIHDILTKAHHGNPNVMFPTTNVSETEFESKLQQGGEVFLLIYNHIAVGVIMIAIEKCGKWYAGKSSAALRYLAVMPEYSGRGFASMLVNKCCDWASEHGIDTLLWTTAENNKPALMTAKKNGFHKTDFFKFSGLDHYSIRLVKSTKENRLKSSVYYWIRFIRVKIF